MQGIHVLRGLNVRDLRSIEREVALAPSGKWFVSSLLWDAPSILSAFSALSSSKTSRDAGICFAGYIVPGSASNPVPSGLDACVSTGTGVVEVFTG